MSILSVLIDENLSYPAADDFFSPDEFFPEYQFGHISFDLTQFIAQYESYLSIVGSTKKRLELLNGIRLVILSRKGPMFLSCVILSITNEPSKAKMTSLPNAPMLPGPPGSWLYCFRRLVEAAPPFGNAPVQSGNGRRSYTANWCCRL